ncbi:hypothetical protein NC653_023751 [Populus alba x Populus x berolinensis]|nr:hypothetical protein NC653_023751 [Populus alba x Populus x berolinensis]
MDVDAQPTMDETILVGDDLMMGPPSPIIPPEIASHVLEGVDLCDGILRNLFLCLQINDIEPFCQDELALYRHCAERRDKELRQRLQDSECKLGSSMPLDEAKERASQLESEVTSLERRLILASGIEGIEGFRQRWSLHGRLTDTKKRLESLTQGIENRKNEVKNDERAPSSTTRRWFFWLNLYSTSEWLWRYLATMIMGAYELKCTQLYMDFGVAEEVRMEAPDRSEMGPTQWSEEHLEMPLPTKNASSFFEF